MVEFKADVRIKYVCVHSLSVCGDAFYPLV